MTEEQAIEIIENVYNDPAPPREYEELFESAIEMAIKALEKQGAEERNKEQSLCKDKELLEFVPKEKRCEFCGKEATLYCDRPKNIMVNSIDFKKHIITCDKKICAKCTTRIDGFDYCPECIQKIKVAKKGLK